MKFTIYTTPCQQRITMAPLEIARYGSRRQMTSPGAGEGLAVGDAAAATGICCFENVDGASEFRRDERRAGPSERVVTVHDWRRNYAPGALTLK